ncbi:hypothetical protein HK101_010947, partial [Irineochytrium annulatum]
VGSDGKPKGPYNAKVFLSADDQIVNAGTVLEHLKGSEVDTHVFPGCTHGAFMLTMGVCWEVILEALE